MAIADDMEIVQVILPKSYLPKVDALRGPGQRSRSAIIRRMVEHALDINFFSPEWSVNEPQEVKEDQSAEQPADVTA